MKTIFNNIIAIVLFSGLLFFSSCEENYLKYDTSYSGVYFVKDSSSYSFSVTPVEIRTHEYRIPIAIMGAVSDNKRVVGYEVCSELTTAENGVQYTIGEVCILPDSITGYLPVIVNRDNLDKRYELCLRLASNGDFVPTLDSLHQVHMFRFDNFVSQPGWYNKSDKLQENKIWPIEKLGVWHPLKLIKMVEYFHALDTIKPETYKKMVIEYGENLEHIVGGYPDMYRGTFDKYIYAPMYKYFSDPANKETIMSEFPDFFDENGNHDFPDPYERK